MRRSTPLLAFLAALVLLLSSCSRDCPSCAELRAGPRIQLFEFTLCVSEVPVFADREGTGCGEIEVEYVAVKK